MSESTSYDIAVIGGGLAGLSLSIQLANQGHSVIVFEKEKYPFHKVCGEYVSLESWNFLEQIGLRLKEMDLPLINTLLLTAPNGKAFTAKLPLGGFGISRFVLDHRLAELAKQKGVIIKENCKVEQVVFKNKHEVLFNGGSVNANVCCAAYGKRSNLDIKWNREFLSMADKRLNNFVGVKYHVKTDWKENIIGLHNFENGYCGISKIENDTFCLCYMTRAENLKNCGNDIKKMEERILFRNPHLKKIFKSCQFLQQFPVTISQINFASKTRVENGVLMLGDAGGMITPLCGNGMSIAFHTSKIASALIDQYLTGKIERKDLEAGYIKQWNEHFAKRLQTGRTLQKFFGKIRLSNLFISIFKMFPFLAKPIIRSTHGTPF